MTSGDWFAMRPSGTEPKLKFYFYAKTDSRQEAEKRVGQMQKVVLDKLS